MKIQMITYLLTEEPLTMNTGMELRFPAVSGRSGPMTPIGLAGKGLIGSDPGKNHKTDEQEVRS